MKKEKHKQKRRVILIDGSNFYFKLRNLGFRDLLMFNFRKFARFLVGENERYLQGTYYVGKVRSGKTDKSKMLFDAQQRLLGRLKNDGFNYSFGYLMKSDNTYHEKGVDVLIAIDMVAYAYDKFCDEIFLVSSDTDLIPAIKMAKKKGLIVQYVGFEGKISKLLSDCCDGTIALSRERINSFLLHN